MIGTTKKCLDIVKMLRFVDDGCGGYSGVHSPFVDSLGQDFINQLGFIYFFRSVNIYIY